MPGEGGPLGGKEAGREAGEQRREGGKDEGRIGSPHQQCKELVMHLASEGPFAVPSCAGLAHKL